MFNVFEARSYISYGYSLGTLRCLNGIQIGWSNEWHSIDRRPLLNEFRKPHSGHYSTHSNSSKFSISYLQCHTRCFVQFDYSGWCSPDTHRIIRISNAKCSDDGFDTFLVFSGAFSRRLRRNEFSGEHRNLIRRTLTRNCLELRAALETSILVSTGRA